MPAKRSAQSLSQSSPTQDNDLPDMPDFDSLPADAGLSNTQAFQLSVRHALALLPRRMASGHATHDAAENSERFTLR